MVMWSGRKRGWGHEVSISVGLVVSFETFLPRRLRRLVFACWVLLRVSWGLDPCQCGVEQALVQPSSEEDISMRLTPWLRRNVWRGSHVEPQSLRLEASVEVVAQPPTHSHGEYQELGLSGATLMRMSCG